MAATTKQPTRKQVSSAPGYKSLDPIRDKSTANGSSQIIQLTVKEYLTELKLWDGDNVTDLKSDASADFQRGILNIDTNKIKQKMFHDLMIGATLPPLIMYDTGVSWEIIDGLQRSDVIVQVLKTIRIRELGDVEKNKIRKFASTMIAEMEEDDESLLTSDEFLEQQLVVQLWKDLEPEELDDLFMILNRGQQRVPDRHLLEVTRSDLYQTFEKWGLPISTQRSEKEHPGHRGRRSDKEKAAHPELEKPFTFRFDFLINGAIAYATQDQHTLTRKTLHEDDTEFNQHIDTVRSDKCEHDFKWICGDLNKIMLAKYGKSKRNVLITDVFFIPTMAALSWARNDSTVASLVESRQAELIDSLNKSESEDPIVLGDPPKTSEDQLRGYNNIKITVKSSIGKKRRDMVYHSWKHYFIYGVRDKNYPVNWKEGSKL